MRPILYSFRRCPYAMRARLAIRSAGITVVVREVVLRDKPKALLQASSKATVPVLVLDTGVVIEESTEIMQWALRQNDPEHLLERFSEDSQKSTRENKKLQGTPGEVQALIAENDGSFKQALDRYKYADRHPEATQTDYRQMAEIFVAKLESRLLLKSHLMGNRQTFVDLAILPFIRQFAGVEPSWFASAPYPRVRAWLNYFMTSEQFETVMQKYPKWQENDPETLFP